jgi:hypothetical protein
MKTAHIGHFGCCASANGSNGDRFALAWYPDNQRFNAAVTTPGASQALHHV